MFLVFLVLLFLGCFNVCLVFFIHQSLFNKPPCFVFVLLFFCGFLSLAFFRVSLVFFRSKREHPLLETQIALLFFYLGFFGLLVVFVSLVGSMFWSKLRVATHFKSTPVSKIVRSYLFVSFILLLCCFIVIRPFMNWVVLFCRYLFFRSLCCKCVTWEYFKNQQLIPGPQCHCLFLMGPFWGVIFGVNLLQKERTCIKHDIWEGNSRSTSMVNSRSTLGCVDKIRTLS